jgi:hypothetical protein
MSHPCREMNCCEKSPESSDKARELGVPVLDEAGLRALLAGQTG